MDIYLYSKRLDVAATTLADLQLLIAALADESDSVNAATIANITGKLATLVQGDTGEPITIYSYDDAATASSWITDATVTLALGLGTPDILGAFTYASTTSFSIVGNTRVGTLALNTTQLQNALGSYAFGSCRTSGRIPGLSFFLHLRKSAAGTTETVCRLQIQVLPGVLSAAPVPLTPDTYLTLAAFYAAAVQNLSSITSLTGGGSAALDGQLTLGSTRFPVGCVVILSYGLVSQLWKLVAGTDAENVSATPAVVRPDDYNAATNAVVWKQIG